jgi:hypothetical protein
MARRHRHKGHTDSIGSLSEILDLANLAGLDTNFVKRGIDLLGVQIIGQQGHVEAIASGSLDHQYGVGWVIVNWGYHALLQGEMFCVVRAQWRHNEYAASRRRI